MSWRLTNWDKNFFVNFLTVMLSSFLPTSLLWFASPVNEWVLYLFLVTGLNCSFNILDFYSLTCYFTYCVIKVIVQLKERWTEDKNDRKSRRSVSLFISPTAEHVAIAYRSQITFLRKDNDYQVPTGTFNSKSDLCGIWRIILLRFWVLMKMRL